MTNRMEPYSWQFLSDAEKQSLKDEMHEVAARMDDLLQKAEMSGCYLNAYSMHSFDDLPSP